MLWFPRAGDRRRLNGRCKRAFVVRIDGGNHQSTLHTLKNKSQTFVYEISKKWIHRRRIGCVRACARLNACACSCCVFIMWERIEHFTLSVSALCVQFQGLINTAREATAVVGCDRFVLSQRGLRSSKFKPQENYLLFFRWLHCARGIYLFFNRLAVAVI